MEYVISSWACPLKNANVYVSNGHGDHRIWTHKGHHAWSNKTMKIAIASLFCNDSGVTTCQSSRNYFVLMGKTLRRSYYACRGCSCNTNHLKFTNTHQYQYKQKTSMFKWYVYTLVLRCSVLFETVSTTKCVEFDEHRTRSQLVPTAQAEERRVPLTEQPVATDPLVVRFQGVGHQDLLHRNLKWVVSLHYETKI